MAGVRPAKALSVHRAAFRFRTDVGMITTAMGLADGMTAAGQRSGFFVIHGHPTKGFAHVQCSQHRIRFAIDTLGVDVDQPHVNRGQRVLHGFGHFKITIAVLGRS